MRTLRPVTYCKTVFKSTFALHRLCFRCTWRDTCTHEHAHTHRMHACVHTCTRMPMYTCKCMSTHRHQMSSHVSVICGIVTPTTKQDSDDDDDDDNDNDEDDNDDDRARGEMRNRDAKPKRRKV